MAGIRTVSSGVSNCARIQALVRRRHQAKNPRIRIGPLEIDTARRLVTRHDETVHLTPSEYALLEFLAIRSGRVFSQHQLLDQLYRLSSNVAHELRTPIAELRNLAEVGAKWPDDRESVLRFFDDAREIGLQMERIVVHLLSLARYDGGIETVQRSDVQLAEVVETVWRLQERGAEKKDLSFRQEVPRALTIETDRDKFELMVSNLLSNAVSYSPAESSILCSAVAENGRSTLTIANRTEHLRPQDLPLIFDRFWRQDAARTGGQHVGLGLSLVRAFADLLGIEIAVDLDADKTFRISLTGPCVTPQTPGET